MAILKKSLVSKSGSSNAHKVNSNVTLAANAVAASKMVPGVCHEARRCDEARGE